MTKLKLPRPSTEAQRLALKSASGGALRLAGGGDAFALSTRIEAPRLSNCCNPMDAGAFLPVDVALDADLAAGAPVITAALAAAQGYDLTPREAPAGQTVTLDGLAQLSRDIGAVVPALATALADGRLDAAERRDVTRVFDSAISTLTALRQTVAAAV